MELKDTEKYVGSFQGCTAQAIRKFRKFFRVPGRVTGVYDDNTQKAMEQVVRILKKIGHDALS